jgi:DNA-directed RNA polymerase subunit RPC12/RpoP
MEIKCPNCKSKNYYTFDGYIRPDFQVEIVECEDCNSKYRIFWEPTEIELGED